MGEISRLAEELRASPEGPCSMESLSYAVWSVRLFGMGAALNFVCRLHTDVLLCTCDQLPYAEIPVVAMLSCLNAGNMKQC
jgi:hypothetical protein